ncbi:MAG: UDP-galactopyranose mutase [Puniceicoccales bacterium]|jgi:UDP-galactopyranose mutase|nr:UDP-galactopyranose mutase [Puniceicoccales bacterium]
MHTQHTHYDYIIVGAGLFGATFAERAGRAGKRCLVVEKRPHSGGNLYCEQVAGIAVHAYGAHIFHTSDRRVWRYVNDLVEFNRYTNSPVANFYGELYNLPFNMNTFYRLWGVRTPAEARERVSREVAEFANIEPRNLEEQALKLVGRDIYEKLIKGYTEKQWGRPAVELPAFIIKRVPLRFTFDNNYFNDTFQGIPVGGYNPLISKMFERAEVVCGVNFFDDGVRAALEAKLAAGSGKILYTGKLDEFFGYKFGRLEYRSLRFETEVLDTPDFQGNAVVNYTDAATPYTRVIEHKHFELSVPLDANPQTVVTREYPLACSENCEPYYPVNDAKNNTLFAQYKTAAGEQKIAERFLFGGRLADYAYYDMDKTIARALDVASAEGL